MLKQPAEWAKHSAVWSAWPSHAELWQEDLAPARAEVAALFHAIADVDTATGIHRGEALNILVHGAEAKASAAAALAGTDAMLYEIPFGDIWLRDTAPIFVSGPDGLQPSCFQFNGWGEKYSLPHDTNVAEAIAARTGLTVLHHGWVLEGGSIDVDGEGLALTTEECLLNPNRNPGLDRRAIERNLLQHLGISKVIWLGNGMLNDHTDGHVDNLARFIGPNHAVVPEARNADDPNREIFVEARKRLEAAKVQVSVVPSYGLVADEDGDAIPATPMNFYIANTRVIVPTYETKWDDAAVAALAKLFPGRETIGLPARHVITGGGSFHCITQQVPWEA
jgi:agmatine deiminase